MIAINTGWGVVSDLEKEQYRSMMGQRDHIGTLDADAVNAMYGCFKVQVSDADDTVHSLSWLHPKQSLGRLLIRIAPGLDVPPDRIKLFTDGDLTTELTGTALSTSLDTLSTAITSATTVFYRPAASSIKFQQALFSDTVLYVETTWKLQRVLDNLKFFKNKDFSASTIAIKNGATVSGDNTKTLATLNIANGAILVVT